MVGLTRPRPPTASQYAKSTYPGMFHKGSQTEVKAVKARHTYDFLARCKSRGICRALVGSPRHVGQKDSKVAAGRRIAGGWNLETKALDRVSSRKNTNFISTAERWNGHPLVPCRFSVPQTLIPSAGLISASKIRLVGLWWFPPFHCQPNRSRIHESPLFPPAPPFLSFPAPLFRVRASGHFPTEGRALLIT